MKNFAIQPMLPEDPREILGDLSADLLTKSGYLSGAMRPQTQKSVAELADIYEDTHRNSSRKHQYSEIQSKQENQVLILV